MKNSQFHWSEPKKKRTCSDCLKVWAKDRDELLKRIGALERQLADLEAANRSLSKLPRGKTSYHSN